jgi:hypothetical protein
LCRRQRRHARRQKKTQTPHENPPVDHADRLAGNCRKTMPGRSRHQKTHFRFLNTH